MDPIRAIIVDDEPLARERVRDLLDADPDVVVAAECADAFEGEEAVRSLSPDLVFLDVQMPERDGFRMLAEIGAERMPVVVFVTAYDQFALRAFEVCALDYLLKPFDEGRFRRTLERAKAQVRAARGAESEPRLLALLERVAPRAEYLERVLVKSGDRFVLVRTDEIDWIAAEGNYVRLHAGASSHSMRETIQNLESQLDPKRFLRIHRSTIVNVDRIREIQPMFHGECHVVLRDGTTLSLGRKYRDRLERVARR